MHELTTPRPWPRRLAQSLPWGVALGGLLFLIALWARSKGRIPDIDIGDLAVGYVGVTSLLFAGVGLLAPWLRSPGAATVYAGAGGAVIGLTLTGLVPGAWPVLTTVGAFFGVPVGAFMLRNDVMRGAKWLCEERPRALS
jgi:hypothetical protein